jgi:dihydroorotase
LTLLIKHGRVYGAAGVAAGAVADVLIQDGAIVAIAPGINPPDAPQPSTAPQPLEPPAALTSPDGATVIDATGLVVAPGLVDMHVHFRDPGFTHKEDILTGASAAAAGGVTTCCCMPNTSPVADEPSVIKYIIDKAKDAPCRVLPYGAVTVGQQGEKLTDFAALKAAGAVALSDDGNPLQNAAIARMAMTRAREEGLLIVSHSEDADLAQIFSVNEGKVSKELGLPGRPAIAEELMIARDAMLAAETGARVHIAHVSTARSVEIIRRAKAAGIALTAETCPQYFSLTEDEVLRQGTLARVNPPLRTAVDVEAIIQGLADGTIDAIATDHAPHTIDEKMRPLTDAPSGMIGLETTLALALTHLYHTGRLGLAEIVRLMSENPARVLGLGAEQSAIGNSADIVVFDPDEEWVVDPSQFRSKARNTPFGGMTLRGKTKYTILGGRIVYGDE